METKKFGILFLDGDVTLPGDLYSSLGPKSHDCFLVEYIQNDPGVPAQ